MIYNILYTANLKPIEERIDFKKLNNYLKTEFINNGLNLPFVFSVINKDGNVVYQSGEFQKQPIASDVITQVLFPNDPPSKLNNLRVYFPTKGDYISSSITFIVPSVIFSLILLITFVFTIYIVFRQKKLSEMKNDFIYNMTNEYVDYNRSGDEIARYYKKRTGEELFFSRVTDNEFITNSITLKNRDDKYKKPVSVYGT